MIPTDSQSRSWILAWRDSGDQTAGRALIDAFYPFIISLIRRHVVDREAIEDLAQQTFVRCFAKIDQWNAEKPLEPWLAQIAVNLCRDHFRTQKSKRELRWSDLTEREQSALSATLQSSPEETERLNEDSRSLLHRLLDTLNADDRMVLSLLYFEDRSTDQIAELSGWSRTLVKVRAFRARIKLRKAFEQLEKSNS